MRVLIVRLDAIGDAILWCGAMEGVREAYPDAEIAIACRPAAAPIYATCPDVDVVFPVAAGRLIADRPDIVLHPVRSRERVAERLVASMAAPVKIALASDTANCTAEERAAFDARYTAVVPSPGEGKHELERHADFLAWLPGAPAPELRPRVWTTAADRAAADRRLSSLGVDPVRTIAFFPEARWRYKRYPAWVEVLERVLEGCAEIETVLLLGDEAGRALADRLAAAAVSVRIENACGDTTLREAIALIARCRLCLGLDTFAIHAAIAQGVPSVAVLGGGHPGRFLPYDPINAVACMPLPCHGCDWRCPYERTHCIEDVPPEVVVAAIRATLDDPPATQPRVFVPTERPADLPVWVAARVQLVEVPAGVAVA